MKDKPQISQISQRVSPASAGRCRSCSNLVTIDATCPLCAKATTPHPEAKEKEGYCQGCAEGPFPLDVLHLVTWNENPYVQIEDGDLYYLCPKCHADRLAEEESE